jgi:transposase
MTMGSRITGGVDTHLDVHVAAALDERGGLLGVEMFATTPAGYAELLSWLQNFGEVDLVGVEGTGSYGAGLTRVLHDHQIEPMRRPHQRIPKYSRTSHDRVSGTHTVLRTRHDAP